MINGFIQNPILIMYLLSIDDIISKQLYNREEYLNAIYQEFTREEEFFNELKFKVRLSRNNIAFNSSNAILSLLFPENFNYVSGNLLIKNGVYISGKITKNQLQTGNKSILQQLYMIYGTEKSSKFINDVYRMSNIICDIAGFTLSYSDCELNEKDLEYTIPNLVIRSVKENTIKSEFVKTSLDKVLSVKEIEKLGITGMQAKRIVTLLQELYMNKVINGIGEKVKLDRSEIQDIFDGLESVDVKNIAKEYKISESDAKDIIDKAGEIEYRIDYDYLSKELSERSSKSIIVKDVKTLDDLKEFLGEEIKDVEKIYENSLQIVDLNIVLNNDVKRRVPYIIDKIKHSKELTIKDFEMFSLTEEDFAGIIKEIGDKSRYAKFVRRQKKLIEDTKDMTDGKVESKLLDTLNIFNSDVVAYTKDLMSKQNYFVKLIESKSKSTFVDLAGMSVSIAQKVMLSGSRPSVVGIEPSRLGSEIEKRGMVFGSYGKGIKLYEFIALEQVVREPVFKTYVLTSLIGNILRSVNAASAEVYVDKNRIIKSGKRIIMFTFGDLNLSIDKTVELSDMAFPIDPIDLLKKVNNE